MNITQFRYAKATLAYPENWKNYSKKNNVALVPAGGVVDSGNGQGVLAWGVIAGLLQGKGTNSGDALHDNTQKLIASLQKENDAMEVETGPAATNVDKAVNAFALPGGFVFINRGAIEAADNGLLAPELV